MRRRAVCLAVLASALIHGCAGPGNCDPSQADFFSGIACESSGAYDYRNQQLQSNLAASRYNLQVQRAGADAAAINAGQAEAARNSAGRALSEMQRQNAALRSRLNAAANREGADRATIERQRAELDALERDRAAAQRNGADQTQINELERRRRAILDAVNSP